MRFLEKLEKQEAKMREYIDKIDSFARGFKCRNPKKRKRAKLTGEPITIQLPIRDNLLLKKLSEDNDCPKPLLIQKIVETFLRNF